jgi:hypothetical protein
MTLVSATMSRIGAMSSSRMCWTMCMANDCSPRRSIGEISAAPRVSAPAVKASMRPTGAARGPYLARTRRQRGT